MVVEERRDSASRRRSRTRLCKVTCFVAFLSVYLLCSLPLSTTVDARTVSLYGARRDLVLLSGAILCARPTCNKKPHPPSYPIYANGFHPSYGLASTRVSTSPPYSMPSATSHSISTTTTHVTSMPQPFSKPAYTSPPYVLSMFHQTRYVRAVSNLKQSVVPQSGVFGRRGSVLRAPSVPRLISPLVRVLSLLPGVQTANMSLDQLEWVPGRHPHFLTRPYCTVEPV